MTQELITSAPGKLMLAGEWAVLELGVPCVVIAIDKKVTVRAYIDLREKVFSVTAPDLKLETKHAVWQNQKLHWQPELTPEEKEKLLMAQFAIETTLKYLEAAGKKILPIGITTASEDCVVQLSSGETKKIGFGSSAAAVVAIVKAILQLHGIHTQTQQELERVFKLSCIAHFEAQGKVGSSFDVAASTFGGVLQYKRFDPTWLQEQYQQGQNLKQIAETPWPALELQPLQLPENFHLLLGYTGPDSSTKEMIQKVNACKETRKEDYWQVIDAIKQCVEELIPAIRQNNPEKITEELQRNRNALIGLSEVSGVELETRMLANLANIAEQNGCAGKLSGSGGGGVGIAVCFDSHVQQIIEAEWKKAGIEPVHASIAPHQG